MFNFSAAFAFRLARPTFSLAWIALGLSPFASAGANVSDVVVYGGTSGGVAAAVQAARLGKSVVLIEPTHRLGGLSSGGLGQTDIGNKEAIGGIAREFYRRIRRHYENPSAWKWQTRSDYQSAGQSRFQPDEDTMWTFEPSVALQVFQNLIREQKVTVVYGERLDLKGGVAVTRSKPWRILSIRTESGRTFRGRMFIDATYEGDLMAQAGVTYTVGREANSQYGETLNGVQTRQATKHQLRPGIDPYVRKGDPSSGLLPGIDPSGPGREGGGDDRVQAYCFRMCLTDQPGNRLPVLKPEGYDERDFELLFRNFEAGFNGVPWNNSRMPNHKTDINNNHGFSTDYLGQNYDYPDGDYATREKIARRHLRYQQGLVWTLANHPRVPEAVRREVSKWGPCKDEFVESHGWPEQLYIREARRMVGALVMTQHHCQGQEVAEDSIGLAAYTMDSHNVQRYVGANEEVRNEGDVQVGGFPPYPISYRAIVPQADQCANLLVPVCLSASHIAFGSIRMEPVFMVLGQSAATAAALAIDENVPVQAVNYPKLRQRSLDDHQVLAWQSSKGQANAGLDPSTLAGVVLDNGQPEVTRAGFNFESASVAPFVGKGYLHDGNNEKGAQWIRFTPNLTVAGRFDVRILFSPHPNRARNVPVTVHSRDGEKTVRVNQRQAPPDPGPFLSLGIFRFAKGSEGSVTVSNRDTDGYVIADAVQFLPVKETGANSKVKPLSDSQGAPP
jgi:FAD dependent oxidoreductase